MSGFETVIGLEVHVQLATQTKIFTSATHIFGQEPNTQVDAVTIGLPGSLPVLNEDAVDLAIRAALAIDATVHEVSKFDRKHYFYPDLPKGYQITQFDEPYCTNGTISIELKDGSNKDIGVTRIHMEEDAGKLVHQAQGAYSEVDLNRAGTPLCEIVSEPDMRSPEEAYAYLYELKRAIKYSGVSDCEMQEGSLRCDANVSIRPIGQEEFGTKVEVKNLNSFRAVEAAIAYEVQNQTALYQAGRYAEVVQETKLWDPDNKVTKSMRGKEGSADYRYFPDPDLPPLVISTDRIDAIRAALPEFPHKREMRFESEYGLKKATASALTAEKDIADYFEALVTAGCQPKSSANWTREEATRLAAVKKCALEEAAPIPVMATLVKLVDDSKVARVVAKGECDELFANAQTAENVEEYFTSRGMIQEQDTEALTAWVAEAIEQQPQAADDVRGGNPKAIGRLVGATMKLSGGKADPKAVSAEIMKQLGA